MKEDTCNQQPSPPRNLQPEDKFALFLVLCIVGTVLALWFATG